MKASSESGELASLISRALPVAGFVGIAFRQLSRFDLFPGPKKPLESQSGLLVRQVRWSRRKSRGDTHPAERSVGGGFRVRGNPLSRAKGYHKTTPHRKNNEKAAIQPVCSGSRLRYGARTVQRAAHDLTEIFHAVRFLQDGNTFFERGIQRCCFGRVAGGKDYSEIRLNSSHLRINRGT